MSERAIAEIIIRMCQRLNGKNMLAAADGNVSYRINDERILITPAGVNKAYINFDKLALITLDGDIVHGHPSTERSMHLEIYRRCPLAKAIIHAHPPTAIAWTIAHPDLRELPADCMSELVLAVGSIPIVPYVRPGTEIMGTALHPFLPQHRVMLLARHGAISWGEDLSEAYNGMERLEHTALVLKSAYELGGLSTLPPGEFEALKKMRQKIGPKTL